MIKKVFKTVLNTVPRPLLIRFSYLARPFLVWWLRGDTYTDPIDGRSFKKFLPYGYENQRENVLSPSTLSLERHRLLWLYLKRETYFFTAPLKVLHFAPEQAFYKRFRDLKNLDYTTTDLNSPPWRMLRLISVIFLLKIIPLISFFVITFLNTFLMIPKPCRNCTEF